VFVLFVAGFLLIDYFNTIENNRDSEVIKDHPLKKGDGGTSTNKQTARRNVAKKTDQLRCFPPRDPGGVWEFVALLVGVPPFIFVVKGYYTPYIYKFVICGEYTLYTDFV
jgi:hypothetical protein